MTEVNQVKLYKKNTEEAKTPKINDNENNIGSNSDRPSRENHLQEIRNTRNMQTKKISSLFKITIIVGAILIITVIVTIAVILVKKSKKKKQNEDDGQQTTINDDQNSTTNEDQKTIFNDEHGPLEMQTEYKIKTNKNDLKRIYVNQKYFEEINVDGELRTNLVDRKTNYDIYIIDEFPAPEEDKNFYNKTYLCSIAISSECISMNDENCVPRKLVDLIDQDYSHVRNLQEVDNLENFPLPLCFFNLTDNNVFTSISCHKKLSESKVNSIVLDLYFFRPPGIKRFSQKEANITITKSKEGDNELIRETNGGICDIESAFNSFCTTDMNTTKDSEGNLIAYDEEAFTNITNSKYNYYIKKKYTHLIDKTSYLENKYKPEKYNETINKLYPALKDHLKYHEQFSQENFKELYSITKGKDINEYSKRNLVEEAAKIEKEEDLFFYKHYGGAIISIKLKDIPGLVTENMVASNYLILDDLKNEVHSEKQSSDIQRVIKRLKILTEAGNNLANALYLNIKEYFENIHEIITNNVTSMSQMLIYEELSNIFDSTFSLNNLKIIPYEIIDITNNLVNEFEKIKNGIESGALKNNLRILNEYIYQFIKQSHVLLNKISNNLKELGDLIKSPKQAISQISNYYTNHTSTSFINTIDKAKNILNNYYINEVNLIDPQVEGIMIQFKNITLESLEKEINLTNNLINIFESNDLEINGEKPGDFEKTKENLHNISNYLSNIINLFQRKLKNEIEKKGEFFISQQDIENNNETFSEIINQALEIGRNIDNNEYVDKTFDKIMIDFRKNFTSVTKYMEKKVEEEFPLIENALEGEYLKSLEQNKISNELKQLGNNIVNKIINENNLYLKNINESIIEFIIQKKDLLFQLITEINTYFSEESIENIAKSFDFVFNSYLEKTIKDIDKYKILSEEYFNGLALLMLDNKELVKLLENYPVDKTLPPELQPSKCRNNYEIHCYDEVKAYTSYQDQINSKKITKAYTTKYNGFINKIENSKDFLQSELLSVFKEEYLKMLTQIKEILQKLKNNKISDKYPELEELFFIDNHLKIVDNLYNRLNKSISNEIFNNHYLPKIKDYINNQTNKINEIENFIKDKNKVIIVGGEEPDATTDFCTAFNRKRTFTCRNGAHAYIDRSEYKCFDTLGSDNEQNLTVLSYNSDEEFQNEYNNFYSKLVNLSDSYSNIISDLKKKLASIESNILENSKEDNYLNPIQNKTNLLLSEKYSDNLIKGSYRYFKNLLDQRLENMLNSISDKWANSMDILRENVNTNINDFKHSINEFGVMAILYANIITQNLTKIYYDSIIEHLKSELNYTISYYYDCLLQNITSVYQLVYNQIPTNQKGLNNIIDLRKQEVNYTFNEIIEDIKLSKAKTLSIDWQLNIVQTSSFNFFKMDSILSEYIQRTNTNLTNKAKEIYKIKNGKQNDELSLACRFYLENSQNGWQIEDIYQPINDKIFVELNKENFKKILNEKWIFDQDDIINKLSILMYNSNLQIKDSFLLKKEKYREILEKEITKFDYTKENIAIKVSRQFQSQIKDIDINIKNNILNYIHELLDLIKTHLINEEKNVREKSDLYKNDYTVINKTFQDYKDIIVNKLEESLIKIVKQFYENLNEKAYKRIIESGLNGYLLEAEKYISQCEAVEIFNSSYNIGKVIYELVEDLVYEYRNVTHSEIESKYKEYIEKLKKEIGFEEIKNLINDELNPEYSKLYNTLKNQTRFENKVYDLNNDLKEDINTKINTTIENINNILEEIKGDKYNIESVDLLDWQIIDFEGISFSFYKNIELDFNSFISTKKDNEINSINVKINDIIKNNFKILLHNLIFSFGKEFFERIIKYNENLKLKNMYQNLKYSLAISISYYKMLYGLKRNINSMSQDLKIKLYNLNNLDSIIEEKNQLILNLLNNKIEDFIDETSIYFIEKYKNYTEHDVSIRLRVSDSLYKNFIKQIGLISEDLRKEYKSLLKEEFKQKMINSYSKVMNEQSNSIKQLVGDLKVEIRSLFDDFFSLDVENVLIEANNKMNETLDSIEEYKNHFDSFKIPNELIQYINNYGKTIIYPIYQPMQNFINKETKNITLNNLKENSKNFENSYNVNEFLENINSLYYSLKKDNIDIIKNIIINSHGINDYPKKLQNEINRIETINLRRLNGEQQEGDNKEIIGKNILSSFHKLLNISDNTKRFALSFEIFDTFLENIEKNIKKLNLSYEQSQLSINNSFNEKDLYAILNDNLTVLYDLSLNYYNKIRDNFSNLKKYIDESLNEIDKTLKQCANISYETMAEHFENISEKSEDFDIPKNEKDKNPKKIERFHYDQNNQFNISAEYPELEKKARFKFALITEGEGEIKTRKLVASVINQIKPPKIKFEISKSESECMKNYEVIDVDFNNVTYITNLTYDTDSNQIKLITIKDFEAYNYIVETKRINGTYGDLCVSSVGIDICLENDECFEPETVIPPKKIIQDKDAKEETITLEL